MQVNHLPNEEERNKAVQSFDRVNHPLRSPGDPREALDHLKSLQLSEMEAMVAQSAEICDVSFDDIVGNSAAANRVRHIADMESIPWQKSEDPKATVLVLYGVPGIGKSSLAEALANSVSEYE